MTITLRPEQEAAILNAIRSGAYRNPDEVIDWALALLGAQDDWLVENREAIAAKIDRGLDQFERGEFFTDEQSRAEMARRRAVFKRILKDR